MSALWRAYHDWKAAAGPLADFVLPTPFLAEPETPAQDALLAPRVPRHPLAQRLADGLLRREARGREDAAAGRTIVFLEAVPRLALAASVYLRRHGWRVAPAFGRWPLADAVLPSLALGPWLAGVVALAEPRAESGGSGEAPTRPLCLLLDAERRRPVPASALRRRFDNRYEYGSQVFPPPARLRAWGVTQALWAGPAAALAPDLRHYADTLVNAGLLVELVRQADLIDPPAVASHPA